MQHNTIKYQQQIDLNSIAGFSDLLVYKCFVDDGIIMHDNDNYTFQKSYYVCGYDFESMEDNEIQHVTQYLNLIFAGIGTGWVISVNCIRKKNNEYLNTTNNNYNNPLLRLIDREREYYFTKQAHLFTNSLVITFTYTEQQKTFSKLANLFIFSNKNKKIIQNMDIALKTFKNQLNQYVKLINKVLHLKALNNNDTVSYLNYLITGSWMSFKIPKNVYCDLRMLLGEEYISGLEPQVGKKHLRVIAIDNYFPDSSNALMLERLSNLNFELRWNTRFFFQNKLDAQNNIDVLSDLHEQNIVGIKDATVSNTVFASRKYNRSAEYLFEEAENAKMMSMLSNINHGKYGCNIVLHHDDETAVNGMRDAVVGLLSEMGYKARDERINSQDAFLSTLDGDIYRNSRRSFISTQNLVDLLPLSSFFGGLDYHPSQLYPDQSSPMFMVDCNNYQTFRGNLFVNDLGHTLIIGKTGGGKSTLVNFIIASHLRYKDAQFFGLDYKHSMLPLTYGINGEHYDIGVDDTIFQPLSDIDTLDGFDFATTWITTLCELNYLKVDTQISSAIKHALSNLSTMDVEHRTMNNLFLHTKHISNQLADVINLYTGDMSLQSRIFSSNEDKLNFSNINVFELSELINKGAKTLIPALKYIFYKIMGRLDGRPTLIVIEEAWMAFNDPVFANQLDEWLKTLRKLNVYIVIVSLQVREITESPIKNTLLNQLATTIYLPNPDISKTEVYTAYKELGLTDKQIMIIKNAQLKREYYLTNADGDRLFNLDMNYFEIAKCFFSKTSKDDIQNAKMIKKNCNDQFANSWLKHNGINDIVI